MARIFSSAFTSAVLAQRTDEAFLFLMAVSGTGISTVRLVNNYSDITSGGNTYTAFPFYVTLPNDLPKHLPRIQIVIANATRELIDEVRGIAGAPDVALSVVLASDPDTIEWGPFSFKLREAVYDKHTIKGTLRLFDIMSEPYPGESLTSITAPGAY